MSRELVAEDICHVGELTQNVAVCGTSVDPARHSHWHPLLHPICCSRSLLLPVQVHITMQKR